MNAAQSTCTMPIQQKNVQRSNGLLYLFYGKREQPLPLSFRSNGQYFLIHSTLKGTVVILRITSEAGDMIQSSQL